MSEKRKKKILGRKCRWWWPIRISFNHEEVGRSPSKRGKKEIAANRVQGEARTALSSIMKIMGAPAPEQAIVKLMRTGPEMME